MSLVLSGAQPASLPSARPIVWALGAGQCVSWGILYYGFSALLLPMQAGLHASRSGLAGAFSLGLLVAAGAAPWVGRRLDLGGAARSLRLGNWGGVALLVAWSQVRSLLPLYAVWAALGLCLALALYEPAFALIGLLAADEEERVRSLATLTVLGGLASTVFVPLTTGLAEALGWRGALLVLAGLLAASTLILERLALRSPRTAAWTSRVPAGPDRLGSPSESRLPPGSGPGFGLLVAALSLGTLASVSLSSHLIPILVERGESPGRAAWALGLLGMAQLPGRLLVLGGRAAGRNGFLLLAPLVFQVMGLAALAGLRSLPATSLALLAFGLGGGLQTVARPLLVRRLYGQPSAGSLNGALARAQNLARASAPLVAALGAGWVGYRGLLFGLGVALTLAVGLLGLFFPLGSRSAA